VEIRPLRQFCPCLPLTGVTTQSLSSEVCSSETDQVGGLTAWITPLRCPLDTFRILETSLLYRWNQKTNTDQVLFICILLELEWDGIPFIDSLYCEETSSIRKEGWTN
jgi:hypothetical protein